MVAIFNKLANLIGFDTTEDEEIEEEIISSYSQQQKEKEEKVVKFNDLKSKSNISKVSMAMPTYEIEHIIMAPTKFEDAKEIADEIKAKRMLTLNMSAVSPEIAQRILDFISGTSYAVDSKITKVGDNVFIAVPNKVKQINRLPNKEPVNELIKENNNESYNYNDTEEIIRTFTNSK